MASPKVSLQQRCYQGQWNMRRPYHGEIPEENLNIKGLTLRRLLRNIQTWTVCSTESWRTRMSSHHRHKDNQVDKTRKSSNKIYKLV